MATLITDCLAVRLLVGNTKNAALYAFLSGDILFNYLYEFANKKFTLIAILKKAHILVLLWPDEKYVI